MMVHSAPCAGAEVAVGPLGAGEEGWASRTQLVTISCCACARVICPSHTFWRSSFSTVSLGFGDAPGSGQRLRGSFGAPPSSSGTKRALQADRPIESGVGLSQKKGWSHHLI